MPKFKFPPYSKKVTILSAITIFMSVGVILGISSLSTKQQTRNLETYVVEYSNNQTQPTITIEAEEGKFSGSMAKSDKFTNRATMYSKTRSNYDISKNIGSATYDFTVPMSGDYKFYATIYGRNGGEDSFFVQLNNEKKQIWHIRNSKDINTNKKYRYGNLATVTNVPFEKLFSNLEAGIKYSLTFYAREKNTYLDKWQLDLEKPIREPICGDGKCEPGEGPCEPGLMCATQYQCPKDCEQQPIREPICGNSICEDNEKVCMLEPCPEGLVCAQVCHDGYCPQDCEQEPNPECKIGLEDIKPGEPCPTCISETPLFKSVNIKCFGQSNTTIAELGICKDMVVWKKDAEKECQQLGNPECNQNPDEISCQNSGGTWTTFPDSCADICTTQNQEIHIMCAQALTKNCDCGANGCWDPSANKCLPNPNIPKPTPTPTPPPDKETACNELIRVFCEKLTVQHDPSCDYVRQLCLEHGPAR